MRVKRDGWAGSQHAPENSLLHSGGFSRHSCSPIHAPAIAQNNNFDQSPLPGRHGSCTERVSGQSGASPLQRPALLDCSLGLERCTPKLRTRSLRVYMLLYATAKRSRVPLLGVWACERRACRALPCGPRHEAWCEWNGAVSGAEPRRLPRFCPRHAPPPPPKPRPQLVEPEIHNEMRLRAHPLTRGRRSSWRSCSRAF